MGGSGTLATMRHHPSFLSAFTPFTPRALWLGSCLAGAAALAAGCGGGTTSDDDAAVAADAGARADAPPSLADAFVAGDADPASDAGPSIDAASVDAPRSDPDAFVAIDATAPTRSSYSWVVSLIEAERVVDGHTAGVNVDGIDSGSGGRRGSCEERKPDYVSSVTFRPGVDNQLSGALLATLVSNGVDINANIADAMARGTFLLLVTVEGIDDFVEDASVTVRLALAQTESGPMPLTDPDGTISAGQSFRELMLLGESAGAIHGNRLSMHVDRIPIPLVLGSTETTDLTSAELTARISESALFDGEGGGGLSVDALIAFAASNGFETIARAVLPSLADLDPSAADDTVCESISAGFRLEAVAASRVTP